MKMKRVISAMEKEIELLDKNGWDVICEMPFEIEFRETRDMATGFAAKMIADIYRRKGR